MKSSNDYLIHMSNFFDRIIEETNGINRKNNVILTYSDHTGEKCMSYRFTKSTVTEIFKLAKQGILKELTG